MKNLLLVAILLSTQCFATDWECVEGQRHIYHDKAAKPFFTDDFVICHQLENGKNHVPRGTSKSKIIA